jgi:hypothetical protein
MKVAALLIGLFILGFFTAELIGAIAKGRVPLGANLLLGIGFVLTGYYFVG